MGIYASYYAINETQANEYQALLATDNEESVEQLFENLDELDENLSDEDYTELDKLWDGLHFLLTGFASYDNEPDGKTPEQIALYNAFFGQEVLSSEGVMLLNADKVADVVSALNKIDIDNLLKEVDFDKFREADIYPDIWYNEDKDEFLADNLEGHFESFKQFYQNALKNGKSVLIVIG